MGNGSDSNNVLLAITKDTGGTPTFSVFNGSSESRLLASETLPLGEWVHGALDWRLRLQRRRVFTAKADNYLQLWVDEVSLLEADNYTKTYQEAVVMVSDTNDDGSTDNSHNLRIEYMEDSGGASAALSWTQISQDTFNVQYFDSTDFTGTATDGGTVSSINYNSGKDSARWVGVFDFEELDYTFSVTTDGGVRLYVDGNAGLMNGAHRAPKPRIPPP